MSKLEATGELLGLVGQARAVSAMPATADSVEAALVAAVRQGQQDAFGRLYKLYAPMVHGILLTRVPYREVDDLVQDVFLMALKKLDTLREDAAFGGWLAMIARNRANDYHRQTRETEELSEACEGESPSEAEAIELLLVLRTLPDAYCETMVLRFVEGMTGPEIAARTGLTPASVRVNLHRGMKLLREKLGLEASQ